MTFSQKATFQLNIAKKTLSTNVRSRTTIFSPGRTSHKHFSSHLCLILNSKAKTVQPDLEFPFFPNFQCKDSAQSNADQEMLKQLTCRTKNLFYKSQSNETNSYGSLYPTPCSCHQELRYYSHLALQSRGSRICQRAEMVQWVKHLTNVRTCIRIPRPHSKTGV